MLVIITFMFAAFSTANPIDTHPAAGQLEQVFSAVNSVAFAETGLTRRDYLRLIEGNVDYFRRHQDQTGAIIDPVSKGERQYSTPAFALAAGLLVREMNRDDLLDPSTRAMTCALTALVEKKTADGHTDFYIPLLVHAYRQLKDAVPEEQSAKWKALFEKINPETCYRAELRGMNWNVVSCSGELLRRHDQLIAPEGLDAQMLYLEKCLSGHMERLMPSGLFDDPGAPMAYDAFARLWLEDAFADQAYTGKHHARIESFLRTGALSTLLLISPSGEWASGGRSALHNWNEAQIAAICEINAVYWKKQNRMDVAGCFKRVARLSLASMMRWQRESGELWIVKNRAEPETRFAYERYSNHSQYNLLPIAMLAIAYTRADEDIAEKISPSEAGGYVFDVMPTFHKISAAAGGYYVLIETASDPDYNATGLQRVHRAGVPFPALTDTSAGERAYGPKEASKLAISPGICWQSPDGSWLSLADFSRGKHKRTVGAVKLQIASSTPEKADFSVIYELNEPGAPARHLTERYVIDARGVIQTSSVDTPGECRVHFPTLISDGAVDTSVSIQEKRVSVQTRGSTTTIEALDASGPVTLLDERTITHSGYVKRAVAPLKGNSVSLKISLETRK
jgi:hypothetical protein